MTVAKALGMAVTYQVDAEMERSNAPAVPQGWRISKTRLDGREATIVNGPGGGCVACKYADIPRVVPESILYDLATTLLTATPAPAPAQERCSTCGYLTSEREHLGCLRRAVKDLDIATGGPYDAQGVGLTDEALDNLIEDLSEWSRHVVEDTAHQTLEAHVREVLEKNPIIAALRAKGGK